MKSDIMNETILRENGGLNERKYAGHRFRRILLSEFRCSSIFLSLNEYGTFKVPYWNAYGLQKELQYILNNCHS